MSWCLAVVRPEPPRRCFWPLGATPFADHAAARRPRPGCFIAAKLRQVVRCHRCQRRHRSRRLHPIERQHRLVGWAGCACRTVLGRRARLAASGRSTVVGAGRARHRSGVTHAQAPGAAAEAPPVAAQFMLDCTGRAGVIARAKHVRRYDEGPRTVALVGAWRRPAPWPVPDDTHTLIESYDDGWMWSVPIGNGIRHIAAMVDPQRSDLATRWPRTGRVSRRDRQDSHFQGVDRPRDPARRPEGWDASEYGAVAYAGDDWLLVGDAGSFIDPLSSAGVKKALASGWLAADGGAHLRSSTPSMRRHACEFFSAREREIERTCRRESQRFLAAAASGHRHVFWDDRADEPIEHEGERQEMPACVQPI